jgi:hypothetical protein
VYQKIGKTNNLIVLGAQDLWVLLLYRSFFTPGRLSVLDVRAYIVSFLSSLDMNQVPEKTIYWSKCDERAKISLQAKIQYFGKYKNCT